jgi:hypothetical protein
MSGLEHLVLLVPTVDLQSAQGMDEFPGSFSQNRWDLQDLFGGDVRHATSGAN